MDAAFFCGMVTENEGDHRFADMPHPSEGCATMFSACILPALHHYINTYMTHLTLHYMHTYINTPHLITRYITLHRNKLHYITLNYTESYTHTYAHALHTLCCIHDIHTLHTCTQRITCHYLTSHYDTSHHITSHRTTSHHIASHTYVKDVAFQHNTCHGMTRYHIARHPIASHYIT